MKHNLLRYSLSVWLTGVVVSPLIFILILFCEDAIKPSTIDQLLFPGLFIYPILVLAELLLSFITWIIFHELTRLTITFSVKPKTRTWLLFIVGILLTAGTCTIILLELGMFNKGEGNDGTYLALCNCACIGWGTVHYKLKPVAE